MGFEISDQVRALNAQLQHFMDEHIYPREREWHEWCHDPEHLWEVPDWYDDIRNKAMPIAVAAQWLSNWLVSATFPVMNENSYLVDTFNNGFAYWIYGIMSVLAAVFVLKYVPETKGKTLEEMNNLWKKK